MGLDRLRNDRQRSVCRTFITLDDMGEVTEQGLQVAKGISDYGMMAVTAGFFIILSMVMMITIFRWLKNVVDNVLEQQKLMRDILDRLEDNNSAMSDIAEGLRTETQLRIRNLSGFAFDLSVEQVCRLIKKVRTENHIIDHEKTAAKIRKSLQVIHDDRKSRFDTFTYHGKPLSSYCNAEWIEQVANVVESEIYNEDGENNSRAYTNVKLAYDNIKTDFYHRLNN